MVESKDEEEHLDDVVVALEVAQCWLPSQNFRNQIRQLLFAAIKLF